MNDQYRYIDYLKYKYEIDYIERRLSAGSDYLELISKPDSHENIEDFIRDKIDFDCWCDELTPEIWETLVKLKYNSFVEAGTILRNSKRIKIDTSKENNLVRLPTGEKTLWYNYKIKLRQKAFSEVEIKIIEDECFYTLKHLSGENYNGEPTKGLVVGNVQSGKTAHMAGLIAMAADNGWNFFVILTGTIEALRKQTQERLIKDLSGPNQSLSFNEIDHPNPLTNLYGSSLNQLELMDSSLKRYITVCLKHKTHLDNLINWLNKGEANAKNLKVLVIDDEADQASLNTKSKDFTSTNENISILVNGFARKKSNKRTRPKVQAMNYLCYTATPYGNLLNESSRESLYPKDFAYSLVPSPKYIGLKQFFSNSGDFERDNKVLDIIRLISEEELTVVSEIEADQPYIEIPKTLQDSICWFLCSVAALRFRRKNKKNIKSFTMLIHTSVRQNSHEKIGNAIEKWLNMHMKNMDAFVELCRDVYTKETQHFKKQDFLNVMDNYEDYAKVDDYVNFDDFSSELIDLIQTNTDRIVLDDNNVRLKYGKGILLCTDNSKNNGLNSSNEHIRLIYPKDDDKTESNTLAYIVIGGNTLSRGLTLEGLVSSYFGRTVRQGDSLLQMARWFGFKIGYELYPRVWMSEDTLKKYKYISDVNEELFEILVELTKSNFKPTDNPVKFLNTPKRTWLNLTSQNKQQNAETVEWDFCGKHSQTIIFESKEDVIRNNNKLIQSLFSNLGTPQKSEFELTKKNDWYWDDVNFTTIANFLRQYHVSEQSQSFDQIKVLVSWIEQILDEHNFDNWLVIAAGNQPSENESDNWKINNNISIGKVLRKLGSFKGKQIRIGTLDNKRDFLASVKQNDEVFDICDRNWNNLLDKYDDIIESQNMSNKPILLFYCIDKKSVSGVDPSKKLSDYSSGQDLFAFSIRIPRKKNSDRKNYSKRIAIKIDKIEDEEAECYAN